MNFAHNLFLLMFNLSQLHNRAKIIELFIDGMNDAFKPLKLFYSQEKRFDDDLEIKTRNSFFGFVHIENIDVLSDESLGLVQNSVQMLAVILERLVFDEKIQEEKLSIEKIAEKRFEELQETIAELKNARKASLNLIDDLTEEIEKRTRYEKKLKESEERFRLVMENSLDAILITSPDGAVLNANNAACKMFQMTEAEIRLAGRNGLVNPEDTNLPKMLEERKQKGYTSGELTFFRKDGTMFFGDISTSVFKNSKGELRTSMIIRDITERKQAEIKLKNSDRIFEHSVDMMSIAGFDGYFKTLSPAWERTLGWSTEEILAKPWNDFVHPDDIEATDSIKAEIIDGRAAYRFENRYRCKDGSYRWLSWNAFPYPEENVMFAVARDITENKKADEELRFSEERFRTLFEMMAEGVVYQNADGEIISANKAAEKILGLSLEQMLGRKSVDPGWKAVDKNKKELPGEKHPAMVALETGEPVENFIQGIFNPNIDDYVWIIVNSIPQFDKNNDKAVRVFSTFFDITARIKAENELRRLKENLEDEVKLKTRELRERVAELERFQQATIDREYRIKELRDNIKHLQNQSIISDHETNE